MLQAQEVQIASHYPGTGFVTGRLLPFTVLPSAEVKIEGVAIKAGEICSTLADPYYPAVFHVYCQRPGEVTLQVLFTRSGQKEQTEFTIELFTEREPAGSAP